MFTLDQRRTIAHQARAHETFCAWGMHQFQMKYELSDEKLAQWLGCDLEHLYSLCLCRIPGGVHQFEHMRLYVQAEHRHRFEQLLCFLIALAITV